MITFFTIVGKAINRFFRLFVCTSPKSKFRSFQLTQTELIVDFYGKGRFSFDKYKLMVLKYMCIEALYSFAVSVGWREWDGWMAWACEGRKAP